MKRYVSLDIGGTDIKYGIVNERGEVELSGKAGTHIHEGILSLMNKVERLIEDLLKGTSPISGIGVSTAGVVNPETGEIIYAGETMPNYAGVNWKKHLGKTFDLAVKVHNDVNAAALGEGWMGAAKGYETYFCLTLGTGVGGAIVINNQLYLGKNFKAAEIGYMARRKGSNETYEKRAATSRLVQQAKNKLHDGNVTGKEIFEMARKGNPACISLLDDWTEEVSKGIADIICVLDPGLVIIGGGVSSQKDYLIEKLQEKLPHFLPEGFLDHTLLKTAKCGNHAGMIGAIYDFIK